MGPWLVRGEVGQIVFSQSRAHFFAFTHEGGTLTIPAGMTFDSARDAPHFVWLSTACRAVPACSGSTGVEVLRAVVGEMPPPVAL